MRICFWGGPCSGKSTLAAYVYAYLSIAKLPVAVELVTEVAKEYVWDEERIVDFDQIDVWRKQQWREQRLVNKGVIAITDSPSEMGLVYANKDVGDLIKSRIPFAESDQDIHYWLRRTVPFSAVGRYQTTEKEAKEIDGKIWNLVKEVGIDITSIDPIADRVWLSMDLSSEIRKRNPPPLDPFYYWLTDSNMIRN